MNIQLDPNTDGIDIDPVVPVTAKPDHDRCPTTDDGMWPAVMIDIETLGKRTNALVLSIGAVCFDPDSNNLGPKFHMHIDAERAVLDGARIDVSTVLRWMRQSGAARKAIGEGQHDPVSEACVLNLLSAWFHANTIGPVEVWALPPQFDLRILREMAERNGGMGLPWQHGKECCLHTVAGELPEAASIRPRPSLPHDALEDAIAQALWLQAIRRAKRGL